MLGSICHETSGDNPRNNNMISNKASSLASALLHKRCVQVSTL
jgi:hypothetical protein